MTRPRTTTSPSDALGATLSDSKSRLINLEALAHRHDQPSSALGPVGTIVDYIGTTAPTGWAILDGSTITGGASLYPDLWAILPASFKSGTNIVLPDTRGRVAVGRNASDTDFDQIGETGGAKTVTLTTAEMPSHGHSLGPGQSIGMFFGGNTGGFTTLIAQVAAINQGSYQGPYEAMPTGGGGAHNNLQPYITFSKILKLV